MAKFKIGEVAELIASDNDYIRSCRHRLGVEVEVIEGPINHSTEGIVYKIKDSDGLTVWCAECFLKKKRPPKDEGAREWFDKNINTKQEPVAA